MLDSWIRIDANGAITVFTGKAELGQGIKTALIQVAAEELVVEPRASTSSPPTPPARRTKATPPAASRCRTAERRSSTRRRRCARLLIGLASPAPRCRRGGADGRGRRVCAADGRTVTYGELVAGQALHVRRTTAVASERSALAQRHRQVAAARRHPAPRSPAHPIYVQDLRLPGMVHARVVRPPSYGARLRALDTSRVEKMPGVLKVVRDGSYVAVVAEREYQAVMAMRALAQAATWDEPRDIAGAVGHLRLPSASAFAGHRHLRERERAIVRIGHDRGSLPPARIRCMDRSVLPARSASRTRAIVTVWTHSQGVYPLRAAIAEMLRVAEGARALHPHGRLGLLRPQRRRRCRRRRRADRTRVPGTAGARAVDARGGACVGALRLGDGVEREGARSTAAGTSSTGSTTSGATRTPRAPAPAGNLAPAWHPADAVRAAARRDRFRSRPAAAIATRFRSTGFRTRASSITSCRRCRCGFRRCARSAPT